MADTSVQQAFSEQQKKAFEAWKKVVDEQVGRLSTAYEEVAKAEGRGIEQVRTSIDDLAKVMKDSLHYASQYASEWRRLSLEATRRTADLLTRTASL